ncbi:reticuline oxidase-like protein [Phtheirospermum japonicum]|uniref:Reticuline oxidase-like protein n=1 Tax=Phtheirospermum japonicum TaxID=374723 RepID=A0A830BJJ1_9LAMI|nr:reticuline oxidase-like protein [Phtheirospermum japonicum]
MGSLIISFIFTFNTLLVLAVSNPGWGGYPPGSFPSWPPFKPPPFPGGWPPFKPPPSSFPGWPPFKPPPTRQVDARTLSKCIKAPFSDFYSPNINKTTFTSVLNSTAQNFRCLDPSIRKPVIIFRPTDEGQVPAVVKCAQLYNLNIRVRSGGHDYEGLSYISLMKNQQFMILDLYNLRDISVDTQNRIAWVQAGATNGELYYNISQASNNLAFPAGLCSSLGIGGHLTGGGYGSMMRRYGLGADNVLDVRMVDAWGIVRSKENMDDDLFWALSGGGGGSFGIILAWKIRLVRVPSNVTMFTVVKTLEQNGTEILRRWQHVAPRIDSKLFIRVIMQVIPTGPTTSTVLSIYQALYLGDAKSLVRVMGAKFPELGVTAGQCTEMSWIQSVMVIAGFNTTRYTPDYLLQHQPAFLSNYFKAKSDFLRTPMSTRAIEGMWKIFMEQFPPSLMIWNPYGGMMGKIPEDATPFPHRKGVLCKIQYVATWLDPSAASQLRLEDWMRELYKYMGNYVSNDPREAYVNYRDLDIGKKEGTGSNCSHPEIWGPKYFKGNFQRLVMVKTMVDPWNFFNHEQSIPSLMMPNKCTEVI